MARKTDWMDFAHVLHKERQAIQDTLPAAFEVSLTLAAYGFDSGAYFSVTLRNPELDLTGHGTGPTPAKALADAKLRLEKALADRRARKVLIAPAPPALPARAPKPETLF